jgi:hypothetical protein
MPHDSSTPVAQSIAELQDIVRCRCHPAYKDRGLHDPDCDCDSADAVNVVVQHVSVLEARLAKAISALEDICYLGVQDDAIYTARAALKELTA